MLTIVQIMRATPRKIDLNSADVRVINMQKGKRRNGNPVVRANTYTTHNSDGSLRHGSNKYDTWVEGLSWYKSGKPRKISEGYVKVSCSCDYFWAYGCEVELHKRGAADIKFSNGKDPIVRNPAQRPWCCKHLVALFERIQQRGM